MESHIQLFTIIRFPVSTHAAQHFRWKKAKVVEYNLFKFVRCFFFSYIVYKMSRLRRFLCVLFS